MGRSAKKGNISNIRVILADWLKTSKREGLATKSQSFDDGPTSHSCTILLGPPRETCVDRPFLRTFCALWMFVFFLASALEWEAHFQAKARIAELKHWPAKSLHPAVMNGLSLSNTQTIHRPMQRLGLIWVHEVPDRCLCYGRPTYHHKLQAFEGLSSADWISQKKHIIWFYIRINCKVQFYESVSWALPNSSLQRFVSVGATLSTCLC